MILDVKELINKVNSSANEMDLTATRKYIEENLEVLSENKVYLKGNAREIFKFVANNLNSGEQPLTNDDLASIRVINSYATNFDLRGLKLTLKYKTELLLKKEVLNFLNSDAKVLLESMGVIKND